MIKSSNIIQELF